MTAKPKKKPASDHKRVEVKSRAQLRSWLQKNHLTSPSIWLVTYKKSVPGYYLPYDAIVEEALCFGWIDSLPRALDEKRTMIRLSPRQSRSAWSGKNKQRVEKLIREKRMTKHGLRVVRESQRSGTWDLLGKVDAKSLPSDLKKALAQNRKARSYFEAFPPSSKKNILEWIELAKTPETRQKRIKETVSMAQKNLRANHYRQPKSKKEH